MRMLEHGAKRKLKGRQTFKQRDSSLSILRKKG
jgi:hypothetical protein